MELVERKNIDTRKWDAVIGASPVENIFQYSWYLDAVCENWSAIIAPHYGSVLPVPYTTKAGVRQFIQAPFTREYDIIGNDFKWAEAIEFLSGKFKSLHFRNESPDLLAGSKERVHQWLDLKKDNESNYSTNARRILKKATPLTAEVSTGSNVLLDLFIQNVVHKIDTISKEDLIRLEHLLKAALVKKTGEQIVIRDNGTIVAAGFFLFDKKRVTYLKGAATEQAKKDGAMYVLIDFALTHYRGRFETFDFGGSDIDSVAEFYHKFGAHDRVYYDYTLNDLPFWFKALKKLKK
jgi:hypothetical protein